MSNAKGVKMNKKQSLRTIVVVSLAILVFLLPMLIKEVAAQPIKEDQINILLKGYGISLKLNEDIKSSIFSDPMNNLVLIEKLSMRSFSHLV
jgi:hypothetical protein